MPYFPFFANIENMPCLVVGGGQVALRKIEKLLDFSPIIKVVALEACGEIKKLAKRGMITLFERAFNDSDIDGSTFVITATGDRGVNRHISQLGTFHATQLMTLRAVRSSSLPLLQRVTCALAFQQAEKALPLLLT